MRSIQCEYMQGSERDPAKVLSDARNELAAINYNRNDMLLSMSKSVRYIAHSAIFCMILSL